MAEYGSGKLLLEAPSGLSAAGHQPPREAYPPA
jgi:hypothetical protein